MQERNPFCQPALTDINFPPKQRTLWLRNFWDFSVLLQFAVKNGAQSCPLQTQILNHYRSASVVLSFTAALVLHLYLYLCTCTVILPTLFICVSLLVKILFNCTTNKLAHILSRFFIYLKFTLNCKTALTLLTFIFSSRLFSWVILSIILSVLSGGQLVNKFWNATISPVEESLTMINRGSTTTDNRWAIFVV